jgi:hypothetical protein
MLSRMFRGRCWATMSFSVGMRGAIVWLKSLTQNEEIRKISVEIGTSVCRNVPESSFFSGILLKENQLP